MLNPLYTIRNKINPFDAPQAKSQGLLRVDGERRPSTTLRPSPEFIEGRSRTINSQNLPISRKNTTIGMCCSCRFSPVMGGGPPM